MKYLYRNDLKVEFRAVPYATNSHVLEYRISPDQDLTYVKEVNLLWGLIKFSYKRKYNTSWQRAYYFVNYPSAYMYPEYKNYLPIFVWKKSDLDEYKMSYKTLGEFFAMIDEHDRKAKMEWQTKHENYLANLSIWE